MGRQSSGCPNRWATKICSCHRAGRVEAEVYRPVTAGAEYAIVGFDGEGSGWQGRKRMAAANIVDAEGGLVASAASLWVEPRPG